MRGRERRSCRTSREGKMRENKFKAWHKFYGMMDVLILNQKYHRIDALGKNNGKPCEYRLGLDDVELMEFTGLKDKNGKEIYEGDIVYGLQDGVRLFKGECVWSDEYACFEFGSFGESLQLQEIKEPEVIGNIYENPKLLNG
jgi:hypothetical protein